MAPVVEFVILLFKTIVTLPLWGSCFAQPFNPFQWKGVLGWKANITLIFLKSKNKIWILNLFFGPYISQKFKNFFLGRYYPKVPVVFLKIKYICIWRYGISLLLSFYFYLLTNSMILEIFISAAKIISLYFSKWSTYRINSVLHKNKQCSNQRKIKDFLTLNK